MSDLIKVAPSALAVLQAGHGLPMGLEDFQPRDLGLEPTMLRIIQPGSKSPVGKPGQLRFGKEAFDTVDVTFLRAHRLRMLPENDQSPQMLCASTNGRVPHPSVPQPKHEACQLCEYGKWTDGPGGRRIAAPCRNGVAFLGLRPDLTPFWFLCMKSSASPALAFLNGVSTDKRIQALCQCKVRVATEAQKNGAVAYFTPIFTITGLEPLESYLPFYEQTDGFVYLPPLPQGVEEESVPPVPVNTDTWEMPV